MVPVLVIATLVTLARSMGHDPVEEITRHTVWPDSQPTGDDMDLKMGKSTGLSLECIELNAAGIDVGATEIYVAVPPDRDPQPVRCFPTFTADLRAMARLAGSVPHHPRSHGVHWRLLDSALRDSRASRHPRLPGQFQTCQARSGP